MTISCWIKCVIDYLDVYVCVFFTLHSIIFHDQQGDIQLLQYFGLILFVFPHVKGTASVLRLRYVTIIINMVKKWQIEPLNLICYYVYAYVLIQWFQAFIRYLTVNRLLLNIQWWVVTSYIYSIRCTFLSKLYFRVVLIQHTFHSHFSRFLEKNHYFYSISLHLYIFIALL